jgi:hypothetical protein
MKQPRRLVQGAVIASSLLLSSAFVLYRSGALDDVIDTAPRQALAASYPDSSARGGDTVTTDTVRRRPRMFPGSKSAVPIIRGDDVLPADTVETSDTIERREVFMGGSKSLAPLVPVPKDSSREEKR